jgi:hypothetical protein
MNFSGWEIIISLLCVALVVGVPVGIIVLIVLLVRRRREPGPREGN